MSSELVDDEVQLPHGPRLAIRRADGHLRPFLLVHGLASNARLWDGVGLCLAAAGHQVVAVDQRGHGRSEQVADGYTTAQCATDLASICRELDLVGDRAPVVAGQSWGGNVVLTLAAEHAAVAPVAALALVDGGWISLGEHYPTFKQCWDELAPPRLADKPVAELRETLRGWLSSFPPVGADAQLANFAEDADGNAVPRLTREHHREILHSLWADDPRPLFQRVRVPVLLAAAVAEVGAEHAGVALAASLLPDSTTSWYVGAHHDLHAQHPDRLAEELLALARRADMTPGVRQ